MPAPSSPVVPQHGRHDPLVMVIEDNPHDRELLNEAWRDHGLSARFLVAETSEQAFAIIHEIVHPQLPDLILIDVNIPSMDGHSMLSILKSDPQWSSIPMVIWTSSTVEADRERSLTYGASAHLVKPSTFDGYMELVPSLLGFIAPRSPGGESY